MNTPRIFWLGAHRVLRSTELAQLRNMGFEVFSATYKSSIFDYSADRSVDHEQHTTLPRDVFHKLLNAEFFGRSLEPEVAELLNGCFDAVIIAGNPEWLHGFVNIYKGPIIFRVYGNVSGLSEYIIQEDLWRKIIERDNFNVIPFSHEAVEHESRWFQDLCSDYIPYRLADDVFSVSGLWSRVEHDPVISTAIPNIADPSRKAAYDAFNATYPHRIFNILGPQRSLYPDDRIVGELERSIFLQKLASSSGFLYDHRDRVCGMTPIEMMELGAPVLYAPGSLLARLYGEDTPGLVDNSVSAQRKLRHLLNRDAHFISDVVASQETVRTRFDRSSVQPIFDEKFKQILEGACSKSATGERNSAKTVERYSRAVKLSGRDRRSGTKTIAVLLHAPNAHSQTGLGADRFEDISCILEQLVRTLVEETDFRLLLSCSTPLKSVFYDLFPLEICNDRIELFVIDNDRGSGGEMLWQLRRLELIEQMNARDDICLAIVPNYAQLPESLLLDCRLALYLPDYFPHLLQNHASVHPGTEEVEDVKLGLALSQRASAIFTSRDTVADMLSRDGVVSAEHAEKVTVIPVPDHLEPAASLRPDIERELNSRFAGRRLIFYPNANKVGGNVAFFLKVFASLRYRYPDIVAVLTEPVHLVSEAKAIVDTFDLHPHLEIMDCVGDGEIAWLYRNAAALCITSTLEGSFPMALRTALLQELPIVSTRLPEIELALGDATESLLLCNPLDAADFGNKLEVALTRRDHILAKQSRARVCLAEAAVSGLFSERLKAMLDSAMRNAAKGGAACA